MKICPSCKGTFDDNLSKCPADGSELIDEESDPLVGQLFAEQYEILSVLGRGGMSVVYKARHRLMDRIVAIKLLLGQADELSLARFKLEAKAASSLNHPNIITVHDFGIVDKVAYLVMDFLEGTDLGEVLLKEKRVAQDRAIRIFRQTCDGLAHAHGKGIIHRDLKPSNLFLIKKENGEDQLKIVDFGIAKVVSKEGEQPTQLTQTGDIFGSPLYMSPEQCLAQPLDTRTDIYSLGCVMYECLVGSPPHNGNTAFNTMTRHVSIAPPSFAKVAPDLHIDENMEAIVFRCLEKKRADRYQSAAEILDDLPQDAPDSGQWKLRAVAHPIKQRREMSYLRYGFWTLFAILTTLFVYMSLDHGPDHDRGTVLEKTIWNAQTTMAQTLIDAQFYAPAEMILAIAESTAKSKFSSPGRMLTALLLERDVFRKARMFEKLEETNAKIAALNTKVLLDAYNSTIEELDELSQSGSEITTSVNKIMAGITLARIAHVAKGLHGDSLDRHEETLLTRARTVYLKLLGPEDPSIADIEMLMAECYLHQQQTPKVRALLLDAVRIYEKTVGIKDKRTVLAVMKLGQADRDEDNFTSAKQELEKSLNLAEKNFPNDKYLLSRCLRSYADYFNQTGNHDEASKLFARADDLAAKCRSDED